MLRWEQDIEPCDDPAAYLEGKRLWMEHLTREPDNLAFYLHAAQLMSDEDSDERIDLLRQGQDRDESDPKWALELSFWLPLDIRKPASRDAIDIEVAKQSLAQYELAGEDPVGRSRALRKLPEIGNVTGLDAKAREYAELAVRDGTASNDVELNHRGNTVLGKLAVREGDFKEAKARLLGSAAAPSGSDIIWFQPDFALARSLLDEGREKPSCGIQGSGRNSGPMDRTRWRTGSSWSEVVEFPANHVVIELTAPTERAERNCISDVFAGRGRYHV